MSPNSVETILNYHLGPTEHGEHVVYLGTVGERRRKHDPHNVRIEDIRGHEEQFTLETQGFQVVKSPSTVKHIDDETGIKQDYYADCAELLKRVTGATWVRGIAHTIRTESWDDALEKERGLPNFHRVVAASNVRFVHIDQSYDGAYEKLNQLGEGYAGLADTCRWGIINVWRPMKPVHRDNICMCDARTVKDEDLREGLVKFAQLTKDHQNVHIGPTNNKLWEVVGKNHAQHRWYFASDLTPEEALLLKIFDSRTDGTARRSPHTAFKSLNDFGPPRQSLEVRCIVMWENEAATTS